MLDKIDGERLLFFKVGEDIRKVTVSEPPRTMHEITRLLTTKFDNINISGELEYWIKDQKFGVRYQISGAEDIYNGAVLEVITRTNKAPKPMARKPMIGRRVRPEGRGRFNPFSQNVRKRDGWPSMGPPPMPRGPPPMAMGPPPMAMGPPPMAMGPPPMARGPPQKSIVDVRKCSVHNKERTLMNLSKNDEGNWVCNPESQCKTESTLALGEETCSIHKKVRTLPNLEKNKDGEWVCVQGARCKVQKKFDSFDGGFRGGRGRGRKSAFVNSSRTFNGRFAPYLRRGRGGFRGGRGDWPMGTNLGQICSLHGRQRTMANLMNDGGRWVCNPSSECKVPSFGRNQMQRPGFRGGMGRGSMSGISRGGYEGYRRPYDPPGFQPGEGYGSTYDLPDIRDITPRGRVFGGGYGPGRENFGAPGRGSGMFIPGRRGGGFGPGRSGRGMGSDRKDGGLLCRIHGKFRTRANMKSTENGGWECLPNSKCK